MSIPRNLTPTTPRFDPIKLAFILEKVVCREINRQPARKYVRVRYSRFYRGCVTLDVVGCNLRCYFCWSPPSREYPEEYGKFKQPITVYREAKRIAKKRGVRIVRFSGGEPTIGRKHLIQVLRLFDEDNYFDKIILETNGILLGYDETYVKELASITKLVIRVSIKSPNPQRFSEITGALPEYYFLPFRAIKLALDNGMNVHVAAVTDPRICTLEDRCTLINKLSAIDSKLDIILSLEEEEIELYPITVKRLKIAGKNSLFTRVKRVGSI